MNQRCRAANEELTWSWFGEGCGIRPLLLWHACPEHGTKPKANADWWSAKLQRNIDRDAAVRRELEAAGWSVVQVWEHEDPRVAADAVAKLVHRRSAGPDETPVQGDSRQTS